MSGPTSTVGLRRTPGEATDERRSPPSVRGGRPVPMTAARVRSPCEDRPRRRRRRGRRRGRDGRSPGGAARTAPGRPGRLPGPPLRASRAAGRPGPPAGRRGHRRRGMVRGAGGQPRRVPGGRRGGRSGPAARRRPGRPRAAAPARPRVRPALAGPRRGGDGTAAARRRRPSVLWSLARRWAADPDPLVRRAAAAGICEPRLLRTRESAAVAVDVCGSITTTLAGRPRGSAAPPGVRSLRQALGYCWSVAVAADPGTGLPRFDALTDDSDPDVAWIVQENGKKARLARVRAAQPAPGRPAGPPASSA